MRTIFLVATVALLALVLVPQPADAVSSHTYIRCGDKWVSPDYFEAHAADCAIADVTTCPPDICIG